MSDNLPRILVEGLDELGLELDAAVQRKLLDYVALLAKWNRAYNLTAVREPGQMVVRHLLDSLVILPWLQGPRVLDVGTGPGLPGIPLALARPDLDFTLLDSNGKKIRFLIQAVAELGLKNVNVVQSRVEAFRPEVLFETILARAFASITGLIEQTRHLLAANGRYLVMKGVYPVAEVDALPVDFEVTGVHKLQVPGLEAERHLLLIQPKG
jgi:16S rRNA (guanine527-N7)-methyltransferase